MENPTSSWSKGESSNFVQLNFEFGLSKEIHLKILGLNIYPWTFQKSDVLEKMVSFFEITFPFPIYLALYCSSREELSDLDLLYSKYKTFHELPKKVQDDLHSKILNYFPFPDYEKLSSFVSTHKHFCLYFLEGSKEGIFSNVFTAGIRNVLESYKSEIILNRMEKALGVVWDRDTLLQIEERNERAVEEEGEIPETFYMPLSIQLAQDSSKLYQFIKKSLKLERRFSEEEEAISDKEAYFKKHGVGSSAETSGKKVLVKPQAGDFGQREIAVSSFGGVKGISVFNMTKEDFLEFMNGNLPSSSE